jgi:hypothetical protein
VNVLFLSLPFHPRLSREQRSPGVTKGGTFYYPKWLATAAGVAIRSGHDMDLVDAPAAGLPLKAISDRIEANGIEALVCDTSTPSIFNDIHVVETLRAEHPRLRVVLVGRHVSALPTEILAISKNSSVYSV